MTVTKREQDRRIGFLGIDESARDVLRAFRPTVMENCDAILTRFYAGLTGWDELASLIGGSARVDHLKAAQSEHWDRLFAADFDEAYVERATRIGQAHQRIGLEPRWYIGSYSILLGALHELAVKTYGRKRDHLSKLIAAIDKAVLMDMELATSVYISAADNQLKGELSKLADQLEAEVRTSVTDVMDRSGQVRDATTNMNAAAQRMSQSTTTVASASEQATVSVETIATASEELVTTVKEVAGQMKNAQATTERAVNEAKKTGEVIETLSTTADEIGEIVKLISDIAAQTNLLALNATIEAARAGEAGKGFAVVASEVKSLATQTAKATEEIRQQIQGIQEVSSESVDAITKIRERIGEVREVAGAISAAVDEQSAVTQEIARNTQEAATATQDVSASILRVSDSSKTSESTAGELHGHAVEMAERMTSLQVKLRKILRESTAGNRRRHERITIFNPSRIAVNGQWQDCTINDISAGGAEIERIDGLQVGGSVELDVKNLGKMSATILRVTDRSCAMQFEATPEMTAELEAKLAALKGSQPQAA